MRVWRKRTWSPTLRSDTWIVCPPLVSWTESVIVIVRVQPSSVLRLMSLPLIDVIVMSRKPKPGRPKRPKSGTAAGPLPGTVGVVVRPAGGRSEFDELGAGDAASDVAAAPMMRIVAPARTSPTRRRLGVPVDPLNAVPSAGSVGFAVIDVSWVGAPCGVRVVIASLRGRS